MLIMAVFRYEAVDRAGKVVRGAMNAANEQAVAQRLSTMGYALKAIVPAAAAVQPVNAAATRQTAPAAAQPGFPVSVQPVVSLNQLARFYRQLAALVKSGIPVAQALDELNNNIGNKKLRRAAAGMRDRVQQGATLSSSMAQLPRLFPVHATGVIWSGEMGGFLDTALDEVAAEIEQETKENRYASIGWFIAKVSLVFFILSLPALDMKGLLMEGLSQGAKIHNQATGIPSTDFIPSGVTPKTMLQGMAMGYWLAFKRLCIPSFIGWFVIAFAWKRLKRVPPIRRAIDGMLLIVPVWGNLHRERSRARFLKTLYRLYAAGVAPAQSWAAASMSVRNSQLAAQLRSNENDLRQQNSSLEQAFTASRVFAADDTGMVATGVKSGSVPEMLERMSSYHTDSAEGARTLGRQISLHALLLPIIIATGWLLIKVVQGYFNFVFDAPKLLGLE